MAPILVPVCALVELIFSLNGSRTENTLWFKRLTTPDASDLLALAGEVATWWTTNLAPSISNDCALQEVDATWKATGTGPQAIYTTGLPDAGNVPTDSSNNGNAFVVKFGTENIGRSYRGRNYIAGIPAASYTNSVLDTAVGNSIVGAYELLPAAVASAGWTHVVVSTHTGGDPRPTGISTPVTYYIATTLSSRSQRRRNPGVGA